MVDIIVHEIAHDGLPDMERLTGRVAFIFDGCIVSGWPLDEGESWEANSDVGRHGRFHCVTHWVEFPAPLWELPMIANPAPPTSGVDWRGHYIEVTAMRYMDNGLHRAAAMKAAEREARSMEAMTGTMQTVTMPTPAGESGAAEDAARLELPSAQAWLDSHCSVATRDWQRGWDAAREAQAARRARGESNG